VLFHPLLHFGPEHLVANLLGLGLFGGLVALLSARHFLGVVAFAWIGGGLLTWLIAAPGTVTGGASGLVYGLLGFLFSHGLLTRRILPLGLSLASVWFFHQQLWGLLPGQAGISWQCHLAGFLAGTAWAWLNRGRVS
jgi:membrane associated rhomboid family serine protease